MATSQPKKGDRYEGRFLELFKCNTHAIAAENRAMLNAHCRSLKAMELSEDGPPSRPPSANSTTGRLQHGVARRPASAPRTHEAKEPQSTKGLCESLLGDLFPDLGSAGAASKGLYANSKLSPKTWQTRTWTDTGAVGKTHALGGRATKHRPATAPPTRRAVPTKVPVASVGPVWPPWGVSRDVSSPAARPVGNSVSRQRRPQSAPVHGRQGNDNGQDGKRIIRAPFAVVNECGEESTEIQARSRPKSAPLCVDAAHKSSSGGKGQKDDGPRGEQRGRSSSMPAARSSHRVGVTSENIRQIAKEAVREALKELSGTG